MRVPRWGLHGTSYNYGGFGLGLYMSRKIVEAHGGTIEAVTTEVRGTTIIVRLPKRSERSREKSL